MTFVGFFLVKLGRLTQQVVTYVACSLTCTTHGWVDTSKEIRVIPQLDISLCFSLCSVNLGELRLNSKQRI